MSRYNSENDIVNGMFALADEKYKNFQAKLIPNIAEETIMGIRTPVLRKYAKKFYKTEEREKFISDLPHRFYEENNLHAFFIEQEKDFETCIKLIDLFLPYIDNWATCDLMSPAVLRKNKKDLYEKIKEWIKSGKTYTVRYGLHMLMVHYLDDDFSPDCLLIASEVRSEEYYVNMMTAWFFATALAKRYEETLPYIKDHKLSRWCHNKTISKACESYRISADKKEYLRSFRIKSEK